MSLQGKRMFRKVTAFILLFSLSVCSGYIMLTDESGKIETPAYPGSYTLGEEKSWKIVFHQKTNILKVNVTMFRIPGEYPNCSYGYLNFFDNNMALCGPAYQNVEGRCIVFAVNPSINVKECAATCLYVPLLQHPVVKFQMNKTDNTTFGFSAEYTTGYCENGKIKSVHSRSTTLIPSTERTTTSRPSTITSSPSTTTTSRPFTTTSIPSTTTSIPSTTTIMTSTTTTPTTRQTTVYKTTTNPKDTTTTEETTTTRPSATTRYISEEDITTTKQDTDDEWDDTTTPTTTTNIATSGHSSTGPWVQNTTKGDKRGTTPSTAMLYNLENITWITIVGLVIIAAILVAVVMCIKRARKLRQNKLAKDQHIYQSIKPLSKPELDNKETAMNMNAYVITKTSAKKGDNDGNDGNDIIYDDIGLDNRASDNDAKTPDSPKVVAAKSSGGEYDTYDDTGVDLRATAALSRQDTSSGIYDDVQLDT